MKICIFLLFILFGSGVMSTKQIKVLSRHKRWDNNGDMNNNGDMSNMFRGTAGVDYPDLKSIPNTNFRCADQVYEGGLYADVEAQCQVYHVCHEGRKDSFLCGKGTIFNQEILACDYWYSTECEKAPSFYYVNSQIGNSGSSWVQPAGGNQPNNPNYLLQNNGGTSGNIHQPSGHGSHDVRGGSVPQPSGYVYNDGRGGNRPQPAGYDSNSGRGGSVPQPSGFGSNNGRGGNLPQPSGFGFNNNGQNANKEDCCCQKSSYKTPWQFPAS